MEISYFKYIYLYYFIICCGAESYITGSQFKIEEGEYISRSASYISIVKMLSKIECAIACLKTPYCCVSSYEHITEACTISQSGGCFEDTEISQDSVVMKNQEKGIIIYLLLVQKQYNVSVCNY